MPTDVLMPQLGESITEGTIVRWVKAVGDVVDLDEPLFEISTDKVDAEIPSPVGGVVMAIKAEVGETVPVNSVVAVIGGQGESADGPSPTAIGLPVQTKSVLGDGQPERADETASSQPMSRRLSPVVNRLAAEHGVDPSTLVGTGDGGRVTKADVLAGVAARSQPSESSSAKTGTRVEPMSVMRQRIAEHMLTSRRTSALVHTLFDVDFSEVASLRAGRSASERRPSYLSFVVKAVADALVAMPIINASVADNDIVYHDDVNIGIAVALDWGLVVPVIRRADRLSVDEIDAAILALAARARSKQLTPDEVSGGTFTVTNPGAFGSIFGLPIINQPQSAILCVGAIEKRPAVVDDAVVVRLRAFLSLGFDHRLIDGSLADHYLARVKEALEGSPPQVFKAS
jgi:pyruvate dehydrogenase E2 component (dihydrolipoamide acetyltransferase)